MASNALGWTAGVLAAILVVNVVLIGIGAARLAGGSAAGGTYQGSAMLGQASAPVTIVEYSDFQCPYCKRFHDDAFQQIKTQYLDTGKAKLVYKEFPLTSLHPFAQSAAEAAECVLQQGNDRFWKFEELDFANQAQLSDANIRSWALATGVEAAKFDQCVSSHATAAKIAADTAEGRQNSVSGTPSFMIYGPGDTTGTQVVGAQPFSAFQQAIDAKLK